MKEGWEYKKLGEVGEFVRGGNFSKKDFVENGFPCIHYGQIHMRFGVETFKHLSSVPAEMVKPNRCAKKGDLVIAITSEDDAGSCKCTAWMGDYDAYVGGHTVIYRHTMQPKYVSYYFMSPFFQKDKLEFTHGFKVVEISPKDIAKIQIPIPPLSEQQSIVDYLDSAFAKIDAMKANAEKALNEAKALFQSSLKEMLEPKEGWEEKLLGDVCAITSLLVNPLEEQYKKLLHVGGANIISESGEFIDLKTAEEENLISGKFLFDTEDVLYNKIRPYLKKVARPDFSGLCSADMYPLRHKDCISRDFLYYVLITKNFTDYAILNSGRAGMPKVNRQTLFAYRFALPSLNEQQSIVETLDSLKSKVDSLQENYVKISQECDALKQAILRQVFE
jgi:type I restriction enzyme S subunit